MENVSTSFISVRKINEARIFVRGPSNSISLQLVKLS